MLRLIYRVTYSVVPINSSILTITLYSSLITTPRYNDTEYSLYDVVTEFSSVFVYVCVCVCVCVYIYIYTHTQCNKEISSLCLIKHNTMKVCVVGVGIGFNESDL